MTMDSGLKGEAATPVALFYPGFGIPGRKVTKCCKFYAEGVAFFEVVNQVSSCPSPS